MEPLEFKELFNYLSKFDRSGKSAISVLVRALLDVVCLHRPVKKFDGSYFCFACTTTDYCDWQECSTFKIIKGVVG